VMSNYGLKKNQSRSYVTINREVSSYCSLLDYYVKSAVVYRMHNATCYLAIGTNLHKLLVHKKTEVETSVMAVMTTNIMLHIA